MDLLETSTNELKFETKKAEQHSRQTDPFHCVTAVPSQAQQHTSVWTLDLNALCFEVDYAFMVWTS